MPQSPSRHRRHREGHPHATQRHLAHARSLVSSTPLARHRRMARLRRGLRGPRVQESALIQAKAGNLDPSEASEVVKELRTGFRGLPSVVHIGDPIPSEDGTAVLLPLVMADGGATGFDAVSVAAAGIRPTLDATAAVQAAHPDLWVEQAGDASIESVLGNQLDSDFQKAEFLSLPITLGILLLAFGAPFAAGVPVLLALSAVASAIGLSALVSQVLPVTEELASVVLLIGMAVGVDYSLFYVRRAREERLAGASAIDAVEIAAATSGRAVLVSGVAVMVAMSGMLISGNAVFVSFAIGTMLVVAVAMLGSLTVLPALLARFGHRIDRPRVPLLHRLRQSDGQSRLWPALMRIVLSRPAVSLSLGVLIMLGLALPGLSMQLRNSGSDSLPRSLPLVQTYDRIVAAYPQEGTTHTVAIWSEDRLDRTAVSSAAASLATSAQQTELFANGPVNPQFSPDGKVATLQLPIPVDESDPRAEQSVQVLRDTLIPQTLSGLNGVNIGVTGNVAENLDFVHQMSSRLPYVIVFQNEWAEGLLSFQSNGAVISWLPLFLFVVLFGLSMDYHVFVVARIREATQRGLPIREAVAAGITKSASVVTSAAAVMIGVFGIFATLSLLEFKQLGVGLAVAILIDATLVRIVLLPAAMALLGEWNWWLPKALDRLPDLEDSIRRAPDLAEPVLV